MATFSFDINCAGVGISPNNGRSVTVTLDDVDKVDVLEMFSAEEVASHFSHDDLLSHIDVSTVKKYFDLIEPE